MKHGVVLALMVFGAFVALSAGVRPAAADGGITVVAAEAKVNFPAGVTFSLDAEAEQEITGVTLQLNTPTQRYGAFPRNLRPDFTPGRRVSASWTWRRFGGQLPPGSEVTYRWRLTTAAGAVLETDTATVRVDDSRFRWKELRDGPVTVRWYEGDDAFGRTLLATTMATVARLGREQGVELQTPVTVHVYGSQRDLYSALPGLPAWVGGISLGEHDAVLAPIPPSDLEEGTRALAHELAHQLIYQITFHTGIGSKVPTWLNEGLAVVAEGEQSRANVGILNRAVRANALPTLRSIGSGFGGLSGDEAGLAYAASESVVRFLLKSEGAEKMRAVLLEFREGRTADDALTRVYGRGVDEVEGAWRRSLGLQPLDRGAPAPAATAGPEPAAPAEVGRTDEARRGPLLAGGAALVVALLAACGGALLVRRRLSGRG